MEQDLKNMVYRLEAKVDRLSNLLDKSFEENAKLQRTLGALLREIAGPKLDRRKADIKKMKMVKREFEPNLFDMADINKYFGE